MKPKLQKLQQDPTLTLSTSTVGLWPKQRIDQHDYQTMTQCKIQDKHGHETCIDSYYAMEQQIREDAMLSRQIKEEEQNCVE